MQPPPPAQPAPPSLYLATTFDCPGYKIERPLGLAFGLVVRSMGFGNALIGGLKSLGQGEIVEYTAVLEQSRGHALERLIEHGASMGANAVLGVRFDSTEVGTNMAEILAYGTAVILTPIAQ